MTEQTAWDPALKNVGRRIARIDNELERATCEAAYQSTVQTRRRMGAGLALGIKHGLRGLLFSWPLYLLGLAAFVLPYRGSIWLTLFLLPALWLSGVILYRGIRDDYARFVHRVLLKPGALRHILFPPAA